MKTHLKLVVIILLAFNLCCKDNAKGEVKPNAAATAFIAKNDIERIEPPHWWVGFKNDSLQLLVKHDGIVNYTPHISHPGISIEKVSKGDNSNNYLFIDLLLSDATASGKFNITFKHEDKEDLIATYEFKNRLIPAEDYVGFNSSDAIYLITPDRFVNGNSSNDTITTMNEKHIDRTDDYARHGGDIEGITKHLDYIHDLGFTAIWPQPLLTNDMNRGSYHGYAITNLYQIDPRFGTLEDYQGLSQKMRSKGMKLIMDQVANHCGLEHWWMKDLPFKDWINFQEDYETHKDNWTWENTTTSNHRRTTNQDTYASKYDSEGNSNGWFVPSMPDLNQRNPFMAKYLIQNSIWWIETARLGGIRQDTYPYPDKEFMSNWAGAIMTEYPNFSIVGEEWSYNPLLIGYWQDGAKNKDGYDSNLKSTMDFAMQRKVVEALNENESWDNGLVKVYEGLANDFHYVSPKDIMIFPDNHDMSRIFTQLNGNIPNTKMALATYAMMPRIFQMYYGTELLMNDFEKPGDHGLIRTDFPGGWEGDTKNAFTGEGLSDEEKDMQVFVTSLMNYRKQSTAIHQGKTIHFAPENGVYVLTRTLGDETVVLILNKNEQSITLDLNRFAELGLEGKSLRNIISNDTIVWKDNLELNIKGAMVLTTKTK